MADIIPFRGILYNPAKVAGDDVIAPPYDVITPDMRTALYEKSPHNIVRVDFGLQREGDTEAENKYTRASRYMEEWLEEGVMTRGKKPAIYAYRMEYETGKRKKTLTGFFALVKLEEPGRGIYPHEATYSKPKLDRLTLLRVTGANTSPIFSLYNSPRGETASIIENAAREEPYLRAHDLEGSVHCIWPIEDTSLTEKICAEMSDKAVYIADGHHRYETALEYGKAMREGGKAGGKEPFDYVLMFLANIAEGDSLTVLPTHRLIKTAVNGNSLDKISRFFTIEELPASSDLTVSIEGLPHAVGLYSHGRQYVLKYTGGDLGGVNPVLGRLDVVILHEVLIKKLLGAEEYAYEMSAPLAKAKVDGGDYGAAFFLNPTGLSDVESVALSMLRMPPKSTYFYPKVPTGMVINGIRSF